MLALARGRQKKKIMEVIAREAVLGPDPALRRIITGEKAARGRQVVSIETVRQVGDDMNIQVIDSFAGIFPALSPVETAHDAAMLDAEINDL
jgi:hypothetical protein